MENEAAMKVAAEIKRTAADEVEVSDLLNAMRYMTSHLLITDSND